MVDKEIAEYLYARGEYIRGMENCADYPSMKLRGRHKCSTTIYRQYFAKPYFKVLEKPMDSRMRELETVENN